MRVAIALTTCDRATYTERTLLSLQRHNDLSRFTLLQGDDASQDSYILAMGRFLGFELVHRPVERQGHMASIRALVKAAQERGCEWTLILENDYESARGIPWDAIDFDDCDSVRLFGERKMRSGPRALTATHIMGTDRKIEWKPVVYRNGNMEIVSSVYELAPAAHWTPNSITRTGLLAQYTHLPRVKDVCLQWHPPTLRVVDNVLFHIGDVQTEGFRP